MQLARGSCLAVISASLAQLKAKPSKSDAPTFFFITNAIYMLLSEEPGLARRFGDDYLLYKKNVPRWIPRVTPWTPLLDDGGS